MTSSRYLSLNQTIPDTESEGIPSFDVLMDREYRHIAELLAPNKRARDEVRGRIRTLLAMEAHVSETVEVSERDIDRIEKAIKAGTQVDQVFPG
jgi:hypothetical protein